MATKKHTLTAVPKTPKSTKRARAKTPEPTPEAPIEPDLEALGASPAHPLPEAAGTTEAAPMCLSRLCELFMAHLEAGGKHSASTMRTYAMELELACREIGGTMALADITVDVVRDYFASAAVTTLRSGAAKSQLSIDKTRRVLRLALVWGSQEGFVAQPPIPTEETA